MPATEIRPSPARHLPGQASMWFFVIGDLWIFTTYFACYIHDRSQNPDLFLEGQRLMSQGIGVVNTIILLTSSLFIALATQATRAGLFTQARRLVTLAGIGGLAFIVLKGFEWVPKVAAGYTPGSSAFFMYYYMMTGLHLSHVLLGLAILVIVWRELRFAQKPRLELVETGATYWHMVDLLWIVLFALLYLMR